MQEPFIGDATITIFGSKSSTPIVIDSQTTGGNKLIANFGLLKMFGTPRILSSRLLKDINPGDMTVSLEPKLAWKRGEKLAFAPTNMRYLQYDYGIIQSYDSLTGSTILDRALSYYHYGASKSTAS